jgi:hypothetical protein
MNVILVRRAPSGRTTQAGPTHHVKRIEQMIAVHKVSSLWEPSCMANSAVLAAGKRIALIVIFSLLLASSSTQVAEMVGLLPYILDQLGQP